MSIILALLLSSRFVVINNSSCQINLIEDTTKFKIHSENFFNIIINKNGGPIVYFEIDNNKVFQIRFEYLSEYNSPEEFMSSEEDLCGKSYALDQIDWEKKADSSINRTYINLTREKLADNASLTISTVVFHQNKLINNQSISALSEAYLEMTISQWDYSELANGLALNLNVYEAQSQNYEIFGPYFNFSTQKYTLEIINQLGDTFLITFRPIFLIVTKEGDRNEIEIQPFVDYNNTCYNQRPADFWLSFPYQEDTHQIIFGMVCTVIKNLTSSTGIGETDFYLLTMIMFITICYSSRYYKKRKKNNE